MKKHRGRASLCKRVLAATFVCIIGVFMFSQRVLWANAIDDSGNEEKSSYAIEKGAPLASYSLFAGSGVTLSNSNGANNTNGNQEGFMEQEGNVYIGYKTYKSETDADAVFINQRETLIFSGDNVVINGNIIVTGHSNLQLTGKDVEIRGKILLGTNCHLIISRDTNIKCQDVWFFTDDGKVSSKANVSDYESLNKKQISMSGTKTYPKGDPEQYYSTVPLSSNPYYSNPTSIVYLDGLKGYDATIVNGVVKTQDGAILSNEGGITTDPTDENLYPIKNVVLNGHEYDNVFATVVDLDYFEKFCSLSGPKKALCNKKLTSYKKDTSDPNKFLPSNNSFGNSDVSGGKLAFNYAPGKSADFQILFASGCISNPINVGAYMFYVTDQYLKINMDASNSKYCGIFLTSNHVEFKKDTGYCYGQSLMDLDTTAEKTYLKPFIDKVGIQVTDTAIDQIGGSIDNVKYVTFNNLFRGGIKCFYTTDIEVHEHVFSEATCEQPETCACGETRGSALGHQYVNNVCTRCGNERVFDIKDGVLLHYYGTDSEVVIPEGVTSIGAEAFYCCSNVKSIIIPDEVTSIGDLAFFKCSGLENITIPEGVTSIGNNAFYGCSNLTSITLPNSITSMGYCAFYGCPLTKITIPKNMDENMFNDAFEYEHLSNTVFYIYENSTAESFLQQMGATVKYIEDHNPDFVIESGVLVKYIGNGGAVAIPKNVKSVSENMIWNNADQIVSLYIPAKCTEYGSSIMLIIDDISNLENLVIDGPVSSLVFPGSANLKDLVLLNLGANPCWYIGGGNNSPIVYGDSPQANRSAEISGYTYKSIDFDWKERYGFVFEKYYVEDGVLIEYNGKDEEEIIPDTVNKIGDSVFKGCSHLKSITIPDSVTSIGASAFQGCTGLTSITIPNGVTSIGNSAFQGCGEISKIEIPSSVTDIGTSAFEGCNKLEEIEIPAGLQTIGHYAFRNCSSICKATIPEPAVSDFASVFSGCSSLTEVVVLEGTETIANSAFAGNSNLTSVALPDGLQKIGANAFKECTGSLSISIPNSVTSIGASAFQGCTGLTTITIPDSVTSIGTSAFQGCTGLTSITIPDSVITIGASAFQNCTGITLITISDGVTSIGASAFKGCTRVTSMTIPDSVTSIGASAFQGCVGLTAVSLSKGLTSIGQYAFEGCSHITSMLIPDGVNSIGVAAFKGCIGLVEVTVPESLLSVGDSAFNGCTNITSVTIPACMIGSFSSIFAGCDALTEVRVKEGVISIDNNAFKGNTRLTNIILPEGIKSIGSFAFAECTGLKSIVLPSTVETIGAHAFDSCSGLTSIIIPNKVTKIGDYAFSSCTNLSSVAVPGNVKSIGAFAFGNCTLINSLSLEEGIESIGANAFQYCRGIKSIVLPDGIESIGNGAFYKCRTLANITIPQSVTYIGEEVFDDCPYDMVIKGIVGSIAEQYAEEYYIRFVPINSVVYDLAGYDVVISELINLDFYFAISEDDVRSGDIYAKVIYPDGHIERRTFDVNRTRIYEEETYYAIDCLLAAKEMNDVITVQLWSNVTNQACSTKYSYSVKEYCDDLLAHGTLSVSEENLVNAMLTYGKYSQKYFGYNADDVALDSTTESWEEQVAKTIEFLDTIPTEERIGELPNGISLYGYCLVLESTIGYRLYFSANDAETARECGLVYAPEKGMYYSEQFTVSAAELGNLFEFRVGDAVIRSCPLLYVSLALQEERNDELKHLCVSVVDYYSAVLDYAEYLQETAHSGNSTEILN